MINAINSTAEIIAQDVRTNAIKSIQSVSNGRDVTRYTVAGNQYQHIASAPGDAPNTDTGALVNSIQVADQGRNKIVGSDLIYGRHLEFGTRKMRARPFMVPAAEKSKLKVERVLRSEVQKELARL